MNDPILVRVRRPDGSEKILKVPAEHLDRLLALAEGEFGDKSIIGIQAPQQEEKRLGR